MSRITLHDPAPPDAAPLRPQPGAGFGRAALALTLALALPTAARATVPPLRGPMPAAVSRAFAEGGFRLPPALPSGIAPVSTHALWRVPVVLVSYSDSALRYSAPAFQQSLFDTTGTSPTGSVYDYYRTVSGGQVRVIPVVVGVVTVPNPRSYYGGNFWGLNRTSTPENDYGLVRDALTRTSTTIDWSVFDQDRDGYVDVLWVVHAGVGGEGSTDRNDLWSINSQMSNYWLNGSSWATPTRLPGSPLQYIQVDRFSILPELSSFHPLAMSEIGVYCHEFGHALGLPDLYDTQTNGYPNAGPGFWSLMAFGVYGGDGFSPQYPSRPGAWCEQYLGWTQPVRFEHDTTVTLAPTSQGGKVVDLVFQGQPTSDHFLVENRRRTGYEQALPGEGLIVTHADESAIALRLPGNQVNSGLTPALVIVEADGHRDMQIGNNRGDASDPFPGSTSRTFLFDVGPEPSTRTFFGTVTNVGLFDVTPPGPTGAVSAFFQVRAPGWQPEADCTIGDYEPSASFGAGARVVAEPGGNLHLIGNETILGHAQVVLRERLNDVWQPPVQVSHSPAQANEAAIAALPGNDLAVVWTDTRGGSSQIYYRTRLQGIWSSEVRLNGMPGSNYSPTIGTDAHGLVQVAWLNVVGGAPTIELMVFAYPSPFGRVLAVTRPTDRPTVPALAVSRNGGSAILWSDVSLSPPRLRFVHYDPDSGLGGVRNLADPTGNLPQSVQALYDTSGALHSMWLVAGPGTSELHYQRRPRDREPFPPDSSIADIGGVIQNARMALDPGGGVHAVYQATPGAVGQIFYKRWLADRGWDTGATEVTSEADGDALDPVIASSAPGRVTVTFTRYVGGIPRLLQRRRTIDTAVQLDVPPALARVATARATAWPNPLRAGHALSFTVERGDAGARAVEALDVAGRRVGIAALEGPWARREARFGAAATARWAPGIYFVRIAERPGPALRIVVLR